MLRSDAIATRSYALSGFSSIRAARFDIEVIQSDTFEVAVRADEDVIERLSIRTSGKTLILRSRQQFWRFGPLTLEATIKMPTLVALDLSGSGAAELVGFHTLQQLEIVLSGASEVRGTVTAETIDLDASGASRAVLEGSANHVAIRGSGASSLDLRKLAVTTAEVDLSGASRANLNVSSSIESIRASGASHLRYLGEPAIGYMETSGASHVAQA